MPVYEHFLDVLHSRHFQNAERIGACLACKYWNAEGPRTRDKAPKESLCTHPILQEFQLIVSGESGCNAWERAPEVAPEVEELASHSH